MWDHILFPIAKEFNLDIIIVSIGFDAAIGDPLGEYRVTPFGYYVQLEKLMNFAEGRVVLILEGGSNLDFISKSMYDYLEVLLAEKPVIESAKAYSFESTWGVIQEACQE
ncbi:Histone deacetylase 5 [Glycine soja]|nr:Histone deacetylase 5 [Glycine soja]